MVGILGIGQLGSTLNAYSPVVMSGSLRIVWFSPGTSTPTTILLRVLSLHLLPKNWTKPAIQTTRHPALS